jgi:hypothetical protein
MGFRSVHPVIAGEVKDPKGVKLAAELGLDEELKRIAELQKLENPTIQHRLVIEFHPGFGWTILREQALKDNYGSELAQSQSVGDVLRADRDIKEWREKNPEGIGSV